VRKLALSLLASVSICGAASAAPITLNFDDVAAGTVINNQNPFVTVSAISRTNTAITFNTQNPTGGDTDLVLINNATPNPGALTNATSPGGNILIISENLNDSNSDGIIDVPDDEGQGGTLIFDFLQEVTFFGFNGVDFTDFGGFLTVDLFGAAGNLFSFTIDDVAGPGVDLVANVGDETFFQLFDNIFGADGVAGVTQARITLGGSGAVDGLSFHVNEVPIPAALPLMMTALGLGGFASRRRKAKLANA